MIKNRNTKKHRKVSAKRLHSKSHIKRGGSGKGEVTHATLSNARKATAARGSKSANPNARLPEHKKTTAL